MYNFTVLESLEQHPIVKKFLLITAAIILVFFLMLFLPWQQTVAGEGTLTALDPIQRDYEIAATINGFIEEIYVKENEFVKKGDPLFKMIDLDAQYQQSLSSIKKQSNQKYDNEVIKLKHLKENLQSLYRITQVTLEIYDKTINQVKNSLQALSAQKLAISNQKEIDHINYTRIKVLYEEGIESKRQLELRYTQYLQTDAQFQKILLDIQNATSELAITKQKRENFEHKNRVKINSFKNDILITQNLLNTLKQNIKRDTINLSRYQKREVLAKSDGYVVRIYLNDKNRLIKKGENILYFSPIVTQRAIRVKVSDFHMPLIKVGLKTRIIFYGWPSLQISGWPKIQHGTYAGVITAIERSSYQKGAYYAIITEDHADGESLWPSNEHLKIGTQASLWVRISTVPIWYEIWRILSAQPPKMITPGESKK
ncbi:MAG TPA: biotin/lipoyl-binding protein [Sulfurimonas sp.]|nr:biotin/lipoyl-binding protein [Sulfurimonas sp.]